jgi:protein PhnA
MDACLPGAIRNCACTCSRFPVGNILQDGDTVVLIKDLKVKGSPTGLKAGTKVKKIRLVDGDHNIDRRVDEIGQMGLKSEFVKKAQ